MSVGPASVFVLVQSAILVSPGILSTQVSSLDQGARPITIVVQLEHLPTLSPPATFLGSSVTTTTPISTTSSSTSSFPCLGGAAAIYSFGSLL